MNTALLHPTPQLTLTDDQKMGKSSGVLDAGQRLASISRKLAELKLKHGGWAMDLSDLTLGFADMTRAMAGLPVELVANDRLNAELKFEMALTEDLLTDTLEYLAELKMNRSGREMNLSGLSLGFAGQEKTFLGASEEFIGASEEFIGASEEFIGESKEFIGESKEFIGASEEFIGASEEFIGASEEFIGESEEFIGASEEMLLLSEGLADSITHFPDRSRREGSVRVSESAIFGLQHLRSSPQPSPLGGEGCSPAPS